MPAMVYHDLICIGMYVANSKSNHFFGPCVVSITVCHLHFVVDKSHDRFIQLI